MSRWLWRPTLHQLRALDLPILAGLAKKVPPRRGLHLARRVLNADEGYESSFSVPDFLFVLTLGLEDKVRSLKFIDFLTCAGAAGLGRTGAKRVGLRVCNVYFRSRRREGIAPISIRSDVDLTKVILRQYRPYSSR